MKKGYWVIAALIIFSLVFSIIIILLMPDKVPVHYDASGIADRVGSRFENLILPAATILIGLPFIIVGRKVAMKRNEEIVLLSTGIGLMVCLNIVFAVLLLKALHYEIASDVLFLGHLTAL